MERNCQYLADAKISLIGGGKVSKKLTELLFKCGAKTYM